MDIGNVIDVDIFNKLMEDSTMYTQINPEYIIAYFEKPINLSRLIRIIQYGNSRRRRMRHFSHCTA
jgi:hypothetical protein